jgi:hypothetical protein
VVQHIATTPTVLEVWVLQGASFMKKHTKVLGLAAAIGVLSLVGLVGCEKKEAAKPATPAAPAAPATPAPEAPK